MISSSNSFMSTDIDVQQETKKAAEALLQNTPTGVQVVNLSKTYPNSIFRSSDKDVKAVDNLSLCADEGSILCILGHNGAGKTTTINMLVGLFPPTSGAGVIYGKDVTQEMAQIQRYMGVCPQHDILWNELTAREHLLIFAQLKGVPKDNVDREISDKLELVGLAKNRDHRVGTFSGGMKRRLSVAIAAIGEPKIIFLDEPTTGMDPVNRRSVWELIQKMKNGRVIILTTHSMEEADVLGDKISIMAHGNLCAVGNSLHLKNRYGIGYRVNVTVSEMKNKRTVINEIKNIVPEAVILASNAGNLTFGVPLACREKMEPFLKYLESKSAEEGANQNVQHFRTRPIVKEWGISHTSLEDVFLEVTKRENFTYPEDGQKEHEETFVPDDPELVASEREFEREKMQNSKKRSSYAFRALLRKNFSLQKRQRGTNCCQIVTPILVMAILILLQVIIRSQLGNKMTASTIDTFPFPLNAEFTSSIFPNSSSLSSLSNKYHELFSSSSSYFEKENSVGDVENSHTFSKLFENFVFSKKGENFKNFENFEKISVENFVREFSEFSKPSLRNKYNNNENNDNGYNNKDENKNNDELLVKHTRNDTECLEFFFFTKPSDSTANALIGNLPSTNSTSKSGFLAKIKQQSCWLVNDTEVNVPYFVEISDSHTMMTDVFNILSDYRHVALSDLNKAPYNYPLPDGTIEFKDARSDGTISYVLSVNDNPTVRYHRRNNFTRLGLDDASQFSQDSTLIIDPARLAFMSLINDAFGSYLNNISHTALSTKFAQLMPYTSNPDIVGLMEFFGSFLYPIALALQLPVYLYILVLEKADKIREMMSMHGLPKWTYYLSHYIFCLILYLFVISFFYIVGALSQIRLFSQTNFIILFSFLVAWGNSLICLSMLFSTFISSKRAAVVVGYLVALLGSLIAIVIAIGIYADTTTKMPVAYFIWPQFAFVRGIYLLNSACTTNYQCYKSVVAGDEYINCIVALVVSAFVYYLIYLYLDQVMPREFGVPKHPLFFLDSIKNKFNNKKREKDNGESISLLDKAREREREREDDHLPPARTFRDNGDVEAEKGKIKRKEYNKHAPLVINGLAKKYPGADKYSLRELYLAVDSGECFSLLGENGAGKSTSISLLTGLYPPTHGNAILAHHDITVEMEKARLALGVCPQFNVLWDTLTVEEHLLFYTRLKGVSPKDEKAHVATWLNELGLGFAADRPSASLSGGMKRRVSVGIALVGDPSVVFLDEPTTGLDPASRRQLWTILERARPGRAIILTTHSMDEAEVLSNRIGIMALGSMRCIGTPHHLKNLVGNLFHLKINFSEQNTKTAENYILSLFPKANLIRTYKGTSEFHISQEGVLVSEVFAKMEASSRENGIIDWSFSQVGLEEVFQMVVDESHNNNK